MIDFIIRQGGLMTIQPKSQILQHFLRTVLQTDLAGLTDGQLLECYIRQREEAAFAALVRRHGRMVMNVCRRVLGTDHDAEDAFQGTFLVLVRKASSIWPRERVGNWLYGVARMTALRAKSLNSKRRVREQQVANLPEPPMRSRDLWSDVQPVLDEELSRLPDKYRVPIVLCDLEEHSIKEAARQLGWPQGTLAGRLARARVMLARRLTRHGLTVSGGVLATLLAQQARSAVVSNRLVSTTSEAARLFAAGQTASGLLSAGAVTLTEGVLQTMVMTKLKTVTVILVALAAVALTTAGAWYQAAASDAPEAKPQPTRPPNRTDPLLTPRPAPMPADDDPSAEMDKKPDASASIRPALPTCSTPRQALVGLEKEQLYVRTLEIIYEPVTVRLNGYEARTSYQMTELLKTRRYDLNMVKAYDVHGKRIGEKQLPKLLKKETVALISFDTQAADPLNLRLFKEGTLLFILPGAVGPQYYPVYEPAVPAQPIQAAPPVTAIAPSAPAPLRPMPSQPTPPRSVSPHADPASPVPYAPTIPLAPTAPSPTVRPAPTPAPGK